MSFKNIDKEYVANTYGRFDLELTNGHCSLVYDINGKEYIDLATGIAVNTFGIAMATERGCIASLQSWNRQTSSIKTYGNTPY